MPSKYFQRNFTKNNFYHIYNRGSHKQTIFKNHQDYQTFTDILSYYLKFPTGTALSRLPRNLKERNLQETTPTFRLICYCLMPNHFHLLLQQHLHPTTTNNISNFMKRVSLAYAMYFKNKYDHSGNLQEGRFKNVTINTEEQLLYLTKYIHLNPSKLEGTQPSNLSIYQYSSYPIYIDQIPAPQWLNPNEILNLSYYQNTKNPHQAYKKFVEGKQTNPEIISRLTLED
ncbi:transposase [Patescibacteria group bacterium]|nr:transposase [Patescibacteria group bacterium]